MKTLYENSQSGRSFFQVIFFMLLALLIFIPLFGSYIKYKEVSSINKSIKQFVHTVTNASKFYNHKKNFGEMNNREAIKIGLFPLEMLIDEKNIESPLGASVIIKSLDEGKTLAILYNRLTSKECLALTQIDCQNTIGTWKFLITSTTGITPPKSMPKQLTKGDFPENSLPISLTEAQEACNCNTDWGCGLAWFFTFQSSI